MYEIHASIIIHAPPQEVFDALSDHEQFLRGPGMQCRLVKRGDESPNGLGAVREVTTDGRVFTEEVLAFDPPRRYDYVVCRLVDAQGRAVPLKHERGWIELTPTSTGTQVDWRSRFSVTMPLVGWFVERLVGPRAGRGFRELLEQTKAELESRVRS